MARRVVVTGVGVISALGSNAADTWQAILESRCGIGPITQFDCEKFSCRIAAEVKGFDPLQYFEKKELKKVGRFIQFAVAASEEAMKACGLEVTPEIAEMVGVYIGSGIGAFEVIEREHRTLLEKGPDRISPFFIPASIVNLASGNVSIRTGAKGPNSATATACTTSAHCIGDSFRLIQHGYADVMICGGAEACITPMGVGGFAAMRALSTRNDEPERASRPWDKDRDGFVVGEGAGILILEELEFARRRGAPILAEIVGYGMSGDAYHMTAPDMDGPRRSMLAALRNAGINADEVDYLNAHGTSTPLGDINETKAVKAALGETTARRLVISSTKSMTGHLLGAAGALEAIICVKTIETGIIAPTINLDNPDPDCDLDYTPNHAVKADVRVTMSNSFGFGGHNSSVIFKKHS